MIAGDVDDAVVVLLLILDLDVSLTETSDTREIEMEFRFSGSESENFPNPPRVALARLAFMTGLAMCCILGLASCVSTAAAADEEAEEEGEEEEQGEEDTAVRALKAFGFDAFLDETTEEDVLKLRSCCSFAFLNALLSMLRRARSANFNGFSFNGLDGGEAILEEDGTTEASNSPNTPDISSGRLSIVDTFFKEKNLNRERSHRETPQKGHTTEKSKNWV